MNLGLGKVTEVTVARIQRMVGELEKAFALIPEPADLTYDVTLNFAAPVGVPGVTQQTVTIDGVELGDTVRVGAPAAAPAGFLPPVGEVTAANTVRVTWFQFSGVAADPDGAGGTYKIDVKRH